MANALNDRADRNALASGAVAAAAVILLLAGLLDLLRGIMAIAEDEVFTRTPNYTFQFSTTAWGWIHLALGVLALLAGLALFRLALWARIVGVVMASLLIVANFLSVPYYPLWSLTVMAACVFVIWGLCAVRR
ncbi:hypothetical protein [Kitasatospora sp. NPDC051914]|uniref:DUF7144 family membrane protein n=1 Tax=Kitasatospora sp. NPDC051914 TaxID=3154945 RepID=UPI00343AAAD2